jgi:SOS-response transcriptional repressor LexA
MNPPSIKPDFPNPNPHSPTDLRRALKPLPYIPKRQLDVIRFVLDYTSKHRIAPTHHEIAQGLGLKTVSMHQYLSPLETKGLIKRKPGKTRSIRLTPAAVRKLQALNLIPRQPSTPYPMLK